MTSSSSKFLLRAPLGGFLDAGERSSALPTASQRSRVQTHFTSQSASLIARTSDLYVTSWNKRAARTRPWRYCVAICRYTSKLFGSSISAFVTVVVTTWTSLGGLLRVRVTEKHTPSYLSPCLWCMALSLWIGLV